MQGTEAAFDVCAAEYDEHFTFSETGRRQRNRVWKYIGRELTPALYPRVLEINCGTGEDAIHLAKEGYRVTATDLSEKMIEQATLKAEIAGVNIRAMRVPFRLLSRQLVPGSFDVILSDFGGINCIDAQSLRKLREDLFVLLRPGGRLIMVVMGRKCFWESVYYWFKKQPDEANRRLSERSVPVTIGEETFPVWYYDPAEIRSVFKSRFSFVKQIPVGWMLPPSYLDPFFGKKKMLLGTLGGIETIFGGKRMANHADHFLIDFEKPMKTSMR